MPTGYLERGASMERHQNKRIESDSKQRSLTLVLCTGWESTSLHFVLEGPLRMRELSRILTLAKFQLRETFYCGPRLICYATGLFKTSSVGDITYLKICVTRLLMPS